MTERFEAEEVLRSATSGAFPSEGDVLIRVADGWIFGTISLAEIDIEFEDIDGLIDSIQIPDPLLVNVIQEQTTNAGTKIEGILHRNSVAPELEARARFARR